MITLLNNDEITYFQKIHAIRLLSNRKFKMIGKRTNYISKKAQEKNSQDGNYIHKTNMFYSYNWLMPYQNLGKV